MYIVQAVVSVFSATITNNYWVYTGLFFLWGALVAGAHFLALPIIFAFCSHLETAVIAPRLKRALFPSRKRRPPEGDSLIPGLSYDLSLRCIAHVPIAEWQRLRTVSRVWCDAIRSGEAGAVRASLGLQTNIIAFLVHVDSLRCSHLSEKPFVLARLEEFYENVVEMCKGKDDRYTYCHIVDVDRNSHFYVRMPFLLMTSKHHHVSGYSYSEALACSLGGSIYIIKKDKACYELGSGLTASFSLWRFDVLRGLWLQLEGFKERILEGDCKLLFASEGTKLLLSISDSKWDVNTGNPGQCTAIIRVYDTAVRGGWSKLESLSQDPNRIGLPKGCFVLPGLGYLDLRLHCFLPASLIDPTAARELLHRTHESLPRWPSQLQSFYLAGTSSLFILTGQNFGARIDAFHQQHGLSSTASRALHRSAGLPFFEPLKPSCFVGATNSVFLVYRQRCRSVLEVRCTEKDLIVEVREIPLSRLPRGEVLGFLVAGMVL
eukprot:TRINITY_DN514_c0_g1_i2.p1 TRINITY_DN514_c0_g1~~TRINITY_DN514_c0_g1_i2.p1  ORF type:complete len:490 (-),score=5.47 TRINITY_DN514_c0_g1_i2:584-2053(-)